MMPVDDHADGEAPPDSLLPNRTVLACGFLAVALVSAATLPWPQALASTILGTLMVAGADVDARHFLLPDMVTGGALLTGLIAAAALNPFDRWDALTAALAGSVVVAGSLWLMRQIYGWLRQREGMGLGDVKLAAAVGAWLPLDAVPLCLLLASSAVLIAVLLARLRDRPVEHTTKMPFGAFLCPALWLVNYAVQVLST